MVKVGEIQFLVLNQVHLQWTKEFVRLKKSHMLGINTTKISLIYYHHTLSMPLEIMHGMWSFSH